VTFVDDTRIVHVVGLLVRNFSKLSQVLQAQMAYIASNRTMPEFQNFSGQTRENAPEERNTPATLPSGVVAPM